MHCAIINGIEQPDSETATVWANQYLDIQCKFQTEELLQTDALISIALAIQAWVMWTVTDNMKFLWNGIRTNATTIHTGYTGNVLIDCYRLDGTRLWRIDLGKNIRAGAHYTQFMVYDLDSDGKAEMAYKTADGTTDGTGVIIGSPTVDYQGNIGKICWIYSIRSWIFNHF